jgi:hypothetical protein
MSMNCSKDSWPSWKVCAVAEKHPGLGSTISAEQKRGKLGGRGGMANAESCPTRFSLLVTVTFRVVGAMSCFGLIAVDRRAVDGDWGMSLELGSALCWL